MSQRKGQAAMEFLTTYGWMFLVVIGAGIGLTYFGVFHGSAYISSSCSFDSSIACPIYSVSYDESANQYTVSMQIENLLNQNIEVVNLAIGSFVGNSTCTASAIKRTEDSLPYDCDYGGGSDTYSSPDCRISVATYGTQDIDFQFDSSTCDFTGVGIANPNSGEKYSFKIGLIYLSQKSSKPLSTFGQLIDIVNIVNP